MLAAFAPTLDNGWVGWDDPLHFLQNTRYRGLGPAQLRWMFTAPDINQYVPVAWLTFGLDYVLWGMQAWGYHLTSLLFHAVGAILFFGLSRRLLALGAGRDDTDVALAAAFSALLWAIHPLRVESVAWIAARRDVVSGAFFIAAIWLYVSAPAAGPARRRRLAAAALAYAASLLSKPIGVTLPLVLLLLDAYPLRRLPADPRRWGQPEARPVFLEKVPFALLAAAAVLLTRWTLKRAGSLTEFSDYGWAPRLAKACYSLAFYPRKTLWPSGLMVHYEAPAPLDPWAYYFLGSAAFAVIVAVAAWRWRKRWPVVPAAAAYYTLTLSPVSGLVRAGIDFLATDRFGYLPSLGFSLAAAAGWLALMRRPRARPLALAGAVASLAIFGRLTWMQTPVWKDSLTLWGRVLSFSPGQAVANNNYGVALAERGDHEGARRHCAAAARAEPLLLGAHENEGRALLNLGRPVEARAAFGRVVALAPRSVVGHEHLGLAALRSGDAVEALAAFDAASRLRPGEAALRCRRAQALAALERAGEASSEYEACLAQDPTLASSQINYGRLLSATGQHAEAIARYHAALYAEADRAAAHANWAEAALLSGDFSSAQRHARESLRLKPALSAARLTLGNALVRQDRFKEAAVEYRRVLNAEPSHIPARRNLRAIGGRL